MIVTQWFDSSVLPIHVGVYQRASTARSGYLYSLWDGKHWRTSSGTIDNAAKHYKQSMVQDLYWRGLAK